MLHPHSQLRYINDKVGYGVFATEFIPEGTITWVDDELEIRIPPHEFAQQPPKVQEQIEKYACIAPDGTYLISWDFGKYINHCCQCNTMSTGYGFEIAIRDIYPGQEITDEYGIFNRDETLVLNCPQPGCRGLVCKQDFDQYYRHWDEKLKPAIQRIHDVEQPLMAFLDKNTLRQVNQYLKDPLAYVSIYVQKYHGTPKEDGAKMNGQLHHT